MDAEKRHILLYNPISGAGHLDSWHGMFTKILLQRGYIVTATTPNPEALRRELSTYGISEHHRLFISKCYDPSYSLINNFGYGIRSHINSDMHILHLLHIFFKYTIFNIIRVLRDKLFELRGRLRKILHKREAFGLPPRRLFAQLRHEYSLTKTHVDFLLIMYLDLFNRDVFSWSKMDTFCNAWGGLVFHAPLNARESIEKSLYWKSTSLRGLCLFNEDCCDYFARAFPSKCFQYLPDITNTLLPDKEPELVRQLRAAARGRCIIILAGCWDHRKNIMGFCTLAAKADPDVYFFALIGHVYKDTYTDNELASLREFTSNAHGNVFTHLHFIEDECIFNALLAASDIIFTVYKDFQGSSNMLSKAAYFEKPILVSDRYLMGARTRRYGIGLTVPEVDPDMISTLSVLDELRSSSLHREHFAAYRCDFSEKAMGDALENFIQKCCAL